MHTDMLRHIHTAYAQRHRQCRHCPQSTQTQGVCMLQSCTDTHKLCIQCTYPLHTQCSLCRHAHLQCTHIAYTYAEPQCAQSVLHTHRVCASHTQCVYFLLLFHWAVPNANPCSPSCLQCLRVALPLRSLWLLLSCPSEGCAGRGSWECPSSCRNPSPAAG